MGGGLCRSCRCGRGNRGCGRCNGGGFGNQGWRRGGRLGFSNGGLRRRDRGLCGREGNALFEWGHALRNSDRRLRSGGFEGGRDLGGWNFRRLRRATAAFLGFFGNRFGRLGGFWRASTARGGFGNGGGFGLDFLFRFGGALRFGFFGARGAGFEWPAGFSGRSEILGTEKFHGGHGFVFATLEETSGQGISGDVIADGLKDAGDVGFPCDELLEADPVGLREFGVDECGHGIGDGFAGIGVDIHAHAELANEITHRTAPAGAKNHTASGDGGWERGTLRVVGRRIGQHDEVGCLEIAEAFFVGDEFFRDENALRDAEVVGEHLIILYRAVLVGGNRADDDKVGLGVFDQRTDGEVDVLVVPNGTEEEEDLFAAANLPALTNVFGIFANVCETLRTQRDLDGLESRGDGRRMREALVGYADSEGAEGEGGVEFLPPFRANVVLARGEMQVRGVNRFPEHRGEQMGPNPKSRLRGDMAAGENNRGFVTKHFPAEADLVEKGLGGFRDLARHDVAGAARGAFEQACDDWVIRGARAGEI